MLLGYYSHLLQKRWEFLYPRRHEKARRRRPPSATAERKTKRGLAICPSVFPQPLQKTVHPPEGLTPKAKEKWLEEEAALFERECKNEPLPVDKSCSTTFPAPRSARKAENRAAPSSDRKGRPVPGFVHGPGVVWLTVVVWLARHAWSVRFSWVCIFL